MPVEDIRQYSSSKIVALKEAEAIIGNLKKGGKCVGLCHGGFDLTHPGHAKHFESARKLCDVLVVSVTSDRFVAGRKGDGRPVYPDILRAYMAASMMHVDYVVITDFRLATDAIKLLKPNLYIKGPDFIGKQSQGIEEERNAIKDVGGEIKYTEERPLSTTKIIDYIIANVHRPSILLCIDRDGTLIEDAGFLGRDADWASQLHLNPEVVGFLAEVQRKHNVTSIVVTNQSGVAHGFFDAATVGKMHSYLGEKLLRSGVNISSWQFCPDVDSGYAASHPEKHFVPGHVLEMTRRKPSAAMVFDALDSLGKKVQDFGLILVLGDRHEDEGLADTLGAGYINVSGKSREELLKSFGSHLLSRR